METYGNCARARIKFYCYSKNDRSVLQKGRVEYNLRTHILLVGFTFYERTRNLNKKRILHMKSLCHFFTVGCQKLLRFHL